MATRDRDQDKARSFLSRWSQRKQAAEQELEDPARKPEKRAPRAGAEGGAEDRAQTTAAVDPAEVEAVEVEAAGFDLKDLPDIDKMDAGSDFTVFLRAGVPKALKRRALRKLWRVDPVLGFIDGLDDYNLDYTDAATVVPDMKTLYQVGKGMILPEDEAAEEQITEAAAPEQIAEAAAPEQAALEDGREEAETTAADRDQLAEPAVAEREAGAGREAPAPAEPGPAPAVRKRNPGDPVVSNSAATGKAGRRGVAPRPAARSARNRRWGDSDGQ